MPCCGQNRAAASSNRISRAPSSSDVWRPPDTPEPSAPCGSFVANHRIRYVGAQPLSLRGPRTGRVYYLAGAGPADVDEKDIDALLRTQLFVREIG